MRLEIARVEFNLVWIIRSDIVSRLLKFAWYISFSILCYHIFISGSQICVKLGLDTKLAGYTKLVGYTNWLVPQPNWSRKINLIDYTKLIGWLHKTNGLQQIISPSQLTDNTKLIGCKKSNYLKNSFKSHKTNWPNKTNYLYKNSCLHITSWV